MKLVKIGKTTRRIAVICQSFFTANVFYCTVLNLYVCVYAHKHTHMVLMVLTLIEHHGVVLQTWLIVFIIRSMNSYDLYIVLIFLEFVRIL